jgi:hypothetical protein
MPYPFGKPGGPIPCAVTPDPVDGLPSAEDLDLTAEEQDIRDLTGPMEDDL